MFSPIAIILRSKSKPKEKQNRLVSAVLTGEIPVADFIAYFESARGAEMGACADALKHISAQKPELLEPYLELLIAYINHPLPRVRWGVPEAIGNLARVYPVPSALAIPYLLQNVSEHPANSTVIRWCAAFALGEIARYHPPARAQLLPVFRQLVASEQNNGVRNVLIKALKLIGNELPVV